MRLTNLIFLLLLLVATVQCWWPWGGDEEEEADDVKAQEGKEEVEKKEEEEEGFKEQLERDLAGVGQEVVFESEHPAEATKQKEEDLENGRGGWSTLIHMLLIDIRTHDRGLGSV